MLGRQASRLKFLAESFRIPVLVTNQVTTAVSGGGGLTAALGPTWAHAVNTRLIMAAQQDPDSGRPLRVLMVAKSPTAPLTSVAYAITTGGVEWLENARVPAAPAGSVLEMVIANYQAYEIEGTAPAAVW
jgi:RAD51-like protein 1